MSDSASGFGKFVPGFDFLQNLTNLTKMNQGAASALPGVSNWVAPTLDPKELDKRIDELKTVQFWLDQNATALKATIQALELQKMTLATLKGMNVDMTSMANAFKFPDMTARPAPEVKPEPEPEPEPQAEPEPEPEPTIEAQDDQKTPSSVIDPMQLWGALTQQFQQIAAGAMKEVTRHAASSSTTSTRSEPAPKPRSKVAARARSGQAAAQKSAVTKPLAASKSGAEKPASKRVKAQKVSSVRSPRIVRAG
jgi:hypothetical protein